VRSTKEEFFVASVHPDSRSESNQLEAAKRMINRYNLAGKSIPVIIAGDMNDDQKENGSKYLMDNGFDLTYDLADKKINDDCESASNGDGQDCGKKNPRIIDHIYITSKTGATVSTWENIKDNSSDHNPILVEMMVPGLGLADSSASAPPSDEKSETTMVQYAGKSVDLRTKTMLEVADKYLKS